MLELPFVFISGLLGSAHCLGMCGPFALAIGARANTWQANLRRQSCYTFGRMFTYAFLGACAGYGGASMVHNSPTWVRLPAVLSIVAGVFLIYQGLTTAGAMPRLRWPGRKPIAGRTGTTPCLAAGFFGSFLNSPSPRGVLLAGVLTGFLPCGLVYAFLTLAASSASVFTGAALMSVFGLGTAPIMMVTGLGGNLLGLRWRQRLLTIAAWCVVVAGVISIARGAGYLSFTSEPPAGCPFCEQNHLISE
ncbi:MAG: sulfite exporter TauE/SafE family protein [Planctomycetales bacterium]|nr:sulfite exporter TauE/SafE family protein [Planctomycetales bacterium]